MERGGWFWSDPDYVDERILNGSEGVPIDEFVESPDFPRYDNFFYVVSGHTDGYWKVGVAHGKKARGTWRLESYQTHWAKAARVHYIDVMPPNIVRGGRSGISTKEYLLLHDPEMESRLAQGREWFKISWRQLVRCLKRMQKAFDDGDHVPQVVKRSERVLQRDEALLIELEKKIQMMIDEGRFQETRSGFKFALTDSDRHEILGRWT